ncbi:MULTISPECIES: RNA recognition motif domain-containing protein [Crateriforma]|uniref:RNA recognition motif (RRM, RBD, or RNP domain) n=1 Tax=Crateriforma conspicua TaxID=2527996 RepID=A0A5C6G2D7_9PLAN|nr:MULTISPECIES: RNA-binding protein [Crateriforma]TWU67550.1 RNA recognition motif (RRM, RBD, or RNP domain) [Crateriforma conspicua]
MNIYVGNLSFDATENDLESAFGEFGDVASINIIKDRDTGRSRGFAFVEMRDGGAGQEAIAGLNDQQIAGRAVTVNEARPRENRNGGGGRGRW